MSNEHLIEVQPNVFLSPSDPSFHRKYLLFYPNDRESLYQYGLACLAEGEMGKGRALIEKAASLSHPLAVKTVKDWQRETSSETVTSVKPTSKALFSMTFLVWALAVLLFLLLLFAGFVWNTYLYTKETTSHANNHETTYERSLTSEKQGIAPVLPVDEETKASVLPLLVVQSAVEYAQEETGGFPMNEMALVKGHPDNRLSVIPEKVSYTKTATGYTLHYDGKSEPLFEDGLLSLHFYPKTNELALQRGKEVLVLYPVASGEKELPPSNDVIRERVVNPEGKGGAYGSKGLALSDGFAIHGTNQPDSIGQQVTDGCLRLTNEDIDNLYPYVSLGTPFTVESADQTPSEPTFAEGLPPLEGKGGSLATETSVLSYDWKH